MLYFNAAIYNLLYVVSTSAYEHLPAQPFAKVGNFETSSIDEARATNF